jgi:hypothetical protein
MPRHGRDGRLGHSVTASTGWTILKAAGFDHAPERSAPATFLPRRPTRSSRSTSPTIFLRRVSTYSSQIEHQNVGFMLADIKMRLEACRYFT